MDKVEFEKWAISRGCDVSMTDCNKSIYMKRDVQGCWLAWNARQPEIDALKNAIGGITESCTQFEREKIHEIKSLKAEVERLRADAERRDAIGPLARRAAKAAMKEMK